MNGFIPYFISSGGVRLKVFWQWKESTLRTYPKGAYLFQGAFGEHYENLATYLFLQNVSFF
jgi:hypothetical protein